MKQALDRLIFCLTETSADKLTSTLKNICKSDWPALLEQARIHGVAPILFHHLKTIKLISILPEEIQARLKNFYHQNTIRNLLIFKELSVILQKLHQANIPVILLKGSHLIATTYRNLSLRFLNDVDIMVPKPDLEETHQILVKAGYFPKDEFEPEIHCKTEHHLPRHIKPGILGIEVHWTIEKPNSPFPIDIDGLWQRTVAIQFQNIHALGLSLEDLLPQLCIHICYHHHFQIGLKALYDIALLLKVHETEINWQKVENRIRDWKMVNCVQATMNFVQELFQPNLPDFFRKKIHTEMTDSEAYKIAKKYFFEYTGPKPGKFSPQYLSNSKNTFFETFKITFRRIFPNRRELAEKFGIQPSFVNVFFFYSGRLIKLLLRYGIRMENFTAKESDFLNRARNENNKFRLKKWLAEA